MNKNLYLSHFVRLVPVSTLLLLVTLPVTELGAQSDSRPRSVGSLFRELFYGEREQAPAQRPKGRSYNLDAPPSPDSGRYDHDSYAPDPAEPDFRVNRSSRRETAPPPSRSAPPETRKQEAPVTRPKTQVQETPPSPRKQSSSSSSVATETKKQEKPKTSSSEVVKTPSRKPETPKKTELASETPKTTPRKSILKQDAPSSVVSTKKETPSSNTTASKPSLPKQEVPSQVKQEVPTQVASNEMKLPANTNPTPPVKKEETPPTPSVSEKKEPDLNQIKVGSKTGVAGRVKSPYPPFNELDVSGLPSGSLAMDPTTKKVFRIP